MRTISPIFCDEDIVNAGCNLLNCQLNHLPMTYLGLPLNCKKARKEDFQILLDIIRSKLASWRAALLTLSGRLILIWSVLIAIAIFHLLSLDPWPWVLKAIDMVCLDFLWKGSEVVVGMLVANARSSGTRCVHRRKSEASALLVLQI